jgi:hypothetical protein
MGAVTSGAQAKTVEEMVRGARLPAAQTALVNDAFVEVWATVEARFPDEHSRNEQRARLVGILLLLVRVVTDKDFLKSAAYRAFTGSV